MTGVVGSCRALPWRGQAQELSLVRPLKRLAPFVDHIGIEAMAYRDGGQGLAWLAGFREDLAFECWCVAPTGFGDARRRRVVIHYRCPLKNRWAPTLAGPVCLGRWVYRTVTLEGISLYFRVNPKGTFRGLAYSSRGNTLQASSLPLHLIRSFALDVIAVWILILARSCAIPLRVDSYLSPSEGETT